VVIDPNKEKNAITESRKLGLTTVALIDTDCNPDLVDLPIPGNDDSIRSIELIMKNLADAVIEGNLSVAVEEKDEQKPPISAKASVAPEEAQKEPSEASAT